MKAKVARRLLRERDVLLDKATAAGIEAAKAIEARELAIRAATAAEDALRAAFMTRDAFAEAVRSAREKCADAERSIVARRNELIDKHAEVDALHGQTDKLIQVANGLSAKASDPRYAEAAAIVAKADERLAAEAAVKSCQLSAENIAGLKWLARAHRPGLVDEPSHRTVDEDGAERDVDVTRAERKQLREYREFVSIPCPECGAKVGEPCDEAKKHLGE